MNYAARAVGCEKAGDDHCTEQGPDEEAPKGPVECVALWLVHVIPRDQVWVSGPYHRDMKRFPRARHAWISRVGRTTRR